jgi:hypothetical protein
MWVVFLRFLSVVLMFEQPGKLTLPLDNGKATATATKAATPFDLFVSGQVTTTKVSLLFVVTRIEGKTDFFFIYRYW